MTKEDYQKLSKETLINMLLNDSTIIKNYNKIRKQNDTYTIYISKLEEEYNKLLEELELIDSEKTERKNNDDKLSQLKEKFSKFLDTIKYRTLNVDSINYKWRFDIIYQDVEKERKHLEEFV